MAKRSNVKKKKPQRQRQQNKKAKQSETSATGGGSQEILADARKEGSEPRWGTRAADAAVAAAIDGARVMWKAGSLQEAGKDIVKGKSGFRAALKTIAKPARDLVGGITKAYDAAALDSNRAERQLAEAVLERSTETKTRTLKRGGQTETVMRGVITDPQGKPLPGLVVQGRRAGVARTALLAVDVTDDKGRYQLVIDNEALGRAKEPLVSLEIGLGRDALLHAPSGSYKIATGTATDHDVQLPEAAAVRAASALATRGQLDIDRIHSINRRSALLSVQKGAFHAVAGALDDLLKGLAK